MDFKENAEFEDDFEFVEKARELQKKPLFHLLILCATVFGK
jgi:hypothetical protein